MFDSLFTETYHAIVAISTHATPHFSSSNIVRFALLFLGALAPSTALQVLHIVHLLAESMQIKNSYTYTCISFLSLYLSIYPPLTTRILQRRRINGSSVLSPYRPAAA